MSITTLAPDTPSADLNFTTELNFSTSEVSGSPTEAAIFTNASFNVTDDEAARTLETSVAALLALILAILIIIVLCVRSKTRDARIRSARRRVRLDAYDYRTRAEPDREKLRIIQQSIDVLKYRIDDPDQYDRVIPSIMRDGFDWRKEAKSMLVKLRKELPPAFASTVNTMTMRDAVMCIAQRLDPVDVEKFLRIHEAVLFGVHMADGTEGDVSSDDLVFMHSFFMTIMKETR